MQKYLSEQILDKGFDPQMFMSFLEAETEIGNRLCDLLMHRRELGPVTIRGLEDGKTES